MDRVRVMSSPFPPAVSTPAATIRRTNVLGGTMRTTTTALLAAALLLSVTSCSSGNDSNDSNDSKPSAKPSPSKTVDKKDQYLKAARDITFNGAPTDRDLLVFPMLWCHELESGHSVEWMFDLAGGGGLYPVGETWGTKKADANELLVAGVKAYCPESVAAVTDELRASGEY